MNVNRLKRDIFKDLTKFAIIFAAALTIFFVAMYLSYKNEAQFKKLEQQKNSLNNEYNKKNELYNKATADFEEFKKIPDVKKDYNVILDTNPDRLKVALPIIDQLKKKYLFKQFDLSFTNVEEDVTYSSQFFKKYKGQIKIKFDSISDEFSLSFINDLINSLPGYIEIEKFKIDKVSDFNTQLISKYFTDEKFNIVNNEVSLNWYSFKEVAEQPKVENIKEPKKQIKNAKIK